VAAWPAKPPCTGGFAFIGSKKKRQGWISFGGFAFNGLKKKEARDG
jgi:hypothetical protein